MAGTERVWEETQHDRAARSARRWRSRGTRRQVERFVVHPNEIKSLPTGEAVLLTKTPEARSTRVRVIPPRRDEPEAGRTPASARLSPSRG